MHDSTPSASQFTDDPLVLLRKLLAVPAPSGREQEMAQAVCQELEALGYAYEIDSADNVIVRVAGRDEHAHNDLCCLAAHMDEIGMVVTRINDDGTLAVDRSGGLFPWKLGEGPVTVLGDHGQITGILAMGSTHRPDAGQSAVSWADTRIITGLTPAALAKTGVRPGSTAVPTPESRGPIVFGDSEAPLVAAWTFDDRVGVITLLRLLHTLSTQNIIPHVPLLIAFTVHEEGGGHGAKVLAMRERPTTFIAIDGCPMPPGAPLALDGRPGIWSKDRVTHYDQRLVAALMQAAETAHTSLQPVVYDGAASDASLVYAAGGAHRVACFGHVRENSHGYEVAPLAVFDAMHATLVEFVRAWDGS